MYINSERLWEYMGDRDVQKFQERNPDSLQWNMWHGLNTDTLDHPPSLIQQTVTSYPVKPESSMVLLITFQQMAPLGTYRERIVGTKFFICWINYGGLAQRPPFSIRHHMPSF
jgi:hypothetical protein